MNSVTRAAHAKINLTLDVGPRRTDGYHSVRSVMQTVGLHDTVTVTRASLPGVRLHVTGEEAAGVPADETNLVHQAAVRLQKIAAARGVLAGNHSGLEIILHKRIPSQAGLGGGSSDAAATLLAVNDLFGLHLSPARLSKIGAALGADVSFFLTGGTALAEGLGEKITPLPPLAPHWHLIIVKPPAGVSTAAAYAALDAVPSRRTGTATEWWLNGDQTMSNDFEAVVLPAYPEVATAHALLGLTLEAGKIRPLLCGSGAALFLLTATLDTAEQAAAQVRAAGIGTVWVTETVGAGSE